MFITLKLGLKYKSRDLTPLLFCLTALNCSWSSASHTQNAVMVCVPLSDYSKASGQCRVQHVGVLALLSLFFNQIVFLLKILAYKTYTNILLFFFSL